jgi:tRNA G10  N-methylase Trm11
MIEDVARLGYLRSDWRTLDPTYGRGVWWGRWRPDDLVIHDRYTLDGVDFRRLPHEEGEFDAAAFDPPYVCVGGRQSTGLPDMHDRFGLTRAPASPDGVQEDINLGLCEMHRVVRAGGIVVVKCQDYVSSGQLQPGTHWTLTAAFTLGFTLVDRLEHVAGVRPQPPGRRQVHARRNLSTLLVLRRGKQ